MCILKIIIDFDAVRKLGSASTWYEMFCWVLWDTCLFLNSEGLDGRGKWEVGQGIGEQDGMETVIEMKY